MNVGNRLFRVSRLFDSLCWSFEFEEKNNLRGTSYIKIKCLADVSQEYDLAYQVASIDKYH